MKRWVLTTVFILCSLLSLLYAQGTVNRFRQINDRLNREVFPTLNLPAIKNILDSVRGLADPDLYEYAQYFNWYHQAYLDTNIEKRLGNLQGIFRKIASFRNPGIKSLHKFRIGDFLFNQKQYSSGMNRMLEAKTEMADIGYEKIPYAGQLLYILSNHYFSFNNFRQSIAYAALADRYRSGPQTLGAFNTWGMAYLKLELYDSAIIRFKQLIELAESEHSNVWISIASGNLGRTYCLQENFEAGIPLLYKDVIMNRETESTNSAISALYIAEAFTHLHKTDSTLYYINLAKEIFIKYEKWKGEVFERTRFGQYYYTRLADLYKERQDFSRALKFSDTANFYQETYKSQFDWVLLTSSEKRIQEMEYHESMALLDSQKRNEQLQKLLLFAVLGALVIIAALVISRQTIKYRKEKELAKEKENVLELQRIQAEQELETARIQLDEFISKVAEKNELIDSIRSTLANTRPVTDGTETELNAYREILQQSSLLTEEDWQSFKKLFEKVFPGYFAGLSATYPDLTAAEIRLLALTRLSLSSKDMAAMLAISQESLRKSRYRLRKKYPALLPMEE